jgi:hypothetical protein
LPHAQPQRRGHAATQSRTGKRSGPTTSRRCPIVPGCARAPPRSPPRRPRPRPAAPERRLRPGPEHAACRSIAARFVTKSSPSPWITPGRTIVHASRDRATTCSPAHLLSR